MFILQCTSLPLETGEFYHLRGQTFPFRFANATHKGSIVASWVWVGDSPYPTSLGSAVHWLPKSFHAFYIFDTQDSFSWHFYVKEYPITVKRCLGHALHCSLICVYTDTLKQATPLIAPSVSGGVASSSASSSSKEDTLNIWCKNCKMWQLL